MCLNRRDGTAPLRKWNDESSYTNLQFELRTNCWPAGEDCVNEYGIVGGNGDRGTEGGDNYGAEGVS